MSPEGSNFAERMKAIREAAGLSRYAIAKSSGVSESALARIESGEHDPNWRTVLKIAEALGVPVTAFVPTSPSPATAQPASPPIPFAGTIASKRK